MIEGDRINKPKLDFNPVGSPDSTLGRYEMYIYYIILPQIYSTSRM